ncbi:hypothetical protein [Brachyspira pilosicoli]|uniref:hypothetical protein n=1 Tax=Brachyspira pilosicoli TaxID=52584 RepID=UPI00255CB9DE|nr:hypothetical protein [Brachyspira pilosicoli]
MKKAGIIKAKIKQAKRNKRMENIFDRYNKLLHKIFLSVEVDWKYNSPMVSFLKMKIKGKKLKKLKSACRNWKIKEFKIFYL